MQTDPVTTSDRWQPLRALTRARIALGRAGASLPTRPWLEFKLAHAQARDAVHNQLDLEQLTDELAPLGLDLVQVETAAADRAVFLRRPDLGCRLTRQSRAGIEQLAERMSEEPDLAIVLSGGLSALALQQQVPPLLSRLLPKLEAEHWKLAPLVIAPLARVALQDEVGALFRARLALILLGERPGLDAADSLGAYLVYQPQPGKTNAERNCVSNIRAAGLSSEEGAEAIAYLLRRAREQRRSGIALKDERQVIEQDSRDRIE